LPLIDAKVLARSAAIEQAHPFWPCAKGCDLCCRSLPHQPMISAAEWERLAVALGELSPATQRAVRARILESAAGPVICPLLDREHGACLVYDARPVACRSYGFYAERDAGLHCDIVTEAVRAEQAEVVWGNGESLAAELDALGERRTLAAWLAHGAGDAEQR
jgi:Fe-S-cluster containining protein